MLRQVQEHCHHQFSEQSKASIDTPVTAQGFTPYSSDFLSAEGSNAHEKSLFESVSNANLDKFYQFKETQESSFFNAENGEEKVREYGFKIRMEILNEHLGTEKIFLKKIDRSMSKDFYETLIFEKQYQKICLKPQRQYFMKIFLETPDGFERLICSEPMIIQGVKRNLSFISITSELIKLNLQIEKYKDYWVKPLGIKLSVKIIEEFFDEKFKLLNKSEMLNFIQKLWDLKGILYPLSRQNMGSRIIQKLLKKASFEEIEMAITELRFQFVKMVPDKYGNYVIQKIFKVANEEQRTKCLTSIQPQFVELLKTKAGTFSLQSILDNLDQQNLQTVLKIIEPKLEEICLDEFGTHFIQKILQVVQNDNLIQNLLALFESLALDKFGIVVLKVLMKIGSQRQNLRYQILEVCQNKFNEVAVKQYGHYIIQQLFVYYNYYELECILKHIITHVAIFAQNQFSSSIIRRAIELYRDYISLSLIESLLHEGLKELMETPSGSFVLHRLMEMTVNVQYQQKLISSIIYNIDSLNSYEKRYKWSKFFNIQ